MSILHPDLHPSYILHIEKRANARHQRRARAVEVKKAAVMRVRCMPLLDIARPLGYGLLLISYCFNLSKHLL